MKKQKQTQSMPQTQAELNQRLDAAVKKTVKLLTEIQRVRSELVEEKED